MKYLLFTSSKFLVKNKLCYIIYLKREKKYKKKKVILDVKKATIVTISLSKGDCSTKRQK